MEAAKYKDRIIVTKKKRLVEELMKKKIIDDICALEVSELMSLIKKGYQNKK